MRSLARFFLFLVLNFLCIIYAADEKFDITAFRESVEKRIQKKILPNGLRVIVMRNTSNPTVACYLKIGVGSANEPFDRAGTAHFLEHLLFKGTPTLGTTNFEKEKPYLEQIIADGERIDSIDRILLNPLLSDKEREIINVRKHVLENRLSRWQKGAQKYIISEEDSQAYSLAGQMGYNAYTTSDVTNYQIKLPAERLEMWADLESSRFLNPVLREFYPERKVIQEERRMRYDSRPTSLLYELFLKTAFGMSPYGKPVIGFEKSMQRLRYKETYDFFITNYIPSRMVIAIVGDVEFENTFRIIEKYFGRLKARPTPEFPPTVYEPQKGKRIAYLEAKNSPMMITGWARPSALASEDRIFEVLSRVLGDGQTSRLVDRLVIREKLAGSVKIGSTTPGDKLSTEFAIFIDAFDAALYPKIETIIAEELKRIVDEGVSQSELQKVKNRYAAEFIQVLEKNAGMADALSYYDLLLRDWRRMFTSLEEIEGVNSTQIQNLIKKYFTDSQNTTVYIKPTP